MQPSGAPVKQHDRLFTAAEKLIPSACTRPRLSPRQQQCHMWNQQQRLGGGANERRCEKLLEPMK